MQCTVLYLQFHLYKVLKIDKQFSAISLNSHMSEYKTIFILTYTSYLEKGLWLIRTAQRLTETIRSLAISA